MIILFLNPVLFPTPSKKFLASSIFFINFSKITLWLFSILLNGNISLISPICFIKSSLLINSKHLAKSIMYSSNNILSLSLYSVIVNLSFIDFIKSSIFVLISTDWKDLFFGSWILNTNFTSKFLIIEIVRVFNSNIDKYSLKITSFSCSMPVNFVSTS